MLPHSPVLRRAQVAFSTMLVPRPHISLTDFAESVTLLPREDDVSWCQVGEQADWGLLSTRFSMFVEGMVVIVHLVV